MAQYGRGWPSRNQQWRASDPAPYPPAESWDDNNVSQEAWGDGNGHAGPPPGGPPHAPHPMPHAYHRVPAPRDYYGPPPPGWAPAPYGQPPGGWHGNAHPRPHGPPPARQAALTEVLVQQEIDRKEAEIQALRQQLAALEQQEPPAAGGSAGPDGPFAFRASAPSFRPQRPGPALPPEGLSAEAAEQWIGTMEDAEDEVVRQCLERFDAEVRQRIEAEIDEGIESGVLPDGAEPLPEDYVSGEEEEEDEAGLPDDAEYWAFIKADQEAEALAADAADAGTAEADPAAPAAPPPAEADGRD